MKTNNLLVQDLGNLVVLNDKNEQVTLSILWQDKPAMFIFVRHFG